MMLIHLSETRRQFPQNEQPQLAVDTWQNDKWSCSPLGVDICQLITRRKCVKIDKTKCSSKDIAKIRLKWEKLLSLPQDLPGSVAIWRARQEIEVQTLWGWPLLNETDREIDRTEKFARRCWLNGDEMSGRRWTACLLGWCWSDLLVWWLLVILCCGI